jgi:hypothetical protein
MSVQNPTNTPSASLPLLTLTPAQGKIFTQACIWVTVVAVLGIFTTQRFKHAGAWLPSNVPVNIGYWEGVDSPLPKHILEMLGGPRAIGRKYFSPFGEAVETSIVTAGDFENYHDPTICVPANGFILTGLKTINLDGCKIRAMVFKKTDRKYGDIRMLMYYWQQSRDGTTDTAQRQGSYRDVQARFKTGFGAIVGGKQTVLCRIYTIIDPTDPLGAQAQRNVNTIAQAFYQALKENK